MNQDSGVLGKLQIDVVGGIMEVPPLVDLENWHELH